MRSPENEALIDAMWEDYEREGLTGILRWAAVRGRLRTRRGGILDDSRMYWLHRVEAGRIVWTGSSPDLPGLLEDAGLDRRLAQEAYLGLHAR